MRFLERYSYDDLLVSRSELNDYLDKDRNI